MARRELPEVNAGSMADIAFIMLIFFIVSTTLASEKGLKVMLPKWDPNRDNPPVEVNEKDVLAVDVLQDGSLALEGNNFQYSDLKQEVITFLTNEGKNPLYSSSYEFAVINIRTHPEAPYQGYLEAYSNVKDAFDELRDDYSMNKFGIPYDKIPATPEGDLQAREVREKYPLKLAEAMLDEEDQ